MSTLRNATIKLAFENPDLQKHLVPLLKKARPLIEESPVEDILKSGHDSLTSLFRSFGMGWHVTTGMFHRNGGRPKFTWTVSDSTSSLFTVTTIQHKTVSFSRYDDGEDEVALTPTRWIWSVVEPHDVYNLGAVTGDSLKIPNRELKNYILTHHSL